VSPQVPLTPGQGVAVAVEVALHLAGIALFVWLLAGGRARLRPEPALRPWPIRSVEFVLFLCFGVVGATTVNAVAGQILHAAHGSADTATLVASGAAEGGFLVGIAAFFGIYGRAPDSGPARPGPRRAALTGAATFLVAMPFVTVVNLGWDQFLTRTGLPVEKQELVTLLENTVSPLVRWSFIAIAVVLVPLAEETLFRGGLFRYLRTRMPRWAAVASTSIVFGVLHVQWSGHFAGLPSLLPLIALAVVFCLAYERSGTLATPIIAHALFNLNTVFLMACGVSQ
jgi:membrane protease YdiL (CAAX protease family)